ncbi:Alpha-1,3-mannosyltransferase CMT1 [Paramyrothecium foliicola]|nr:Alpha-1,3-mannosyltransferase CMT1 [Paramyrothecium foliicola]
MARLVSLSLPALRHRLVLPLLGVCLLIAIASLFHGGYLHSGYAWVRLHTFHLDIQKENPAASNTSVPSVTAELPLQVTETAAGGVQASSDAAPASPTSTIVFDGSAVRNGSTLDADTIAPFISAILDPSATHLPRLECPSLNTDRYGTLRTNPDNQNYDADKIHIDYFFALDLRQCIGLLPRLLGSIVEAMRFLGPARCALSIVEGNSPDGTGDILIAMQPFMEDLGIAYFYNYSSIDPSKGDRIQKLTQLRNLALDPLTQRLVHVSNTTTVLFINDVAACVEDILELALQRVSLGADMTCAMDWTFPEGAQDPNFYDVWISRDIQGDTFFRIGNNGEWDLAWNLFPNNPDTKARLNHQLPFQVFACWNGATAFTAEPLLAGLRFRQVNAAADECFQGEPELFCKDMWFWGYGKIAVIPSVNLEYTDKRGARVKIAKGYVNDIVKDHKQENSKIEWQGPPQQVLYIVTNSFNKVLEKYGKPAIPWALRARLMGMPKSSDSDIFHDWAKLPISKEQFSQEFREQMRRQFSNCSPLPGAEKLLSKLSRVRTNSPEKSLALALASSTTSQMYALKTSRPETRSLLGYIPANNQILGDDVRLGHGRSKPAPDIYLLALQSLNEAMTANDREPIRPEECLVFEDSAVGVEAGRRAGMRVIWVPHPDVAAEYQGRHEDVLAGRTGWFSIGDDWQLGKLSDGWAECIESLEHFNYERRSVVQGATQHLELVHQQHKYGITTSPIINISQTLSKFHTMTAESNILVLPRPGGDSDLAPQAPISGPTEAAFVETFGKLLPPAKYLNTGTGRAAYYELPPTSTTDSPSRVLLVHGVQTPALGMLPLTKALQASFPQHHFVLVDLWGHGLSETPIVPHEKGLFHKLLDDLLDHLQWSSAHLIGFSFGGALTAGYVATRTSKVQSFTLVAPAGLIRSAKFTTEQQGYLRGGDEAAVRRWVLEFLEGGDLVVPADWEERVERGEVVAEAVREWEMREHPGHLASVVAIFRDGGVLDNRADFVAAVQTGIPSTVVLGELDEVCTQQDLEELGFIDIAVVPRVGHGVVREKVPEVAGFIDRFWKKLE